VRSACDNERRTPVTHGPRRLARRSDRRIAQAGFDQVRTLLTTGETNGRGQNRTVDLRSSGRTKSASQPLGQSKYSRRVLLAARLPQPSPPCPGEAPTPSLREPGHGGHGSMGGSYRGGGTEAGRGIGASQTTIRRAISVPLTSVKKGLSRSFPDALPCRSGRTTARIAQIPKLIVRVRFPSPAPT
jgi:hypothetical protein